MDVENNTKVLRTPQKKHENNAQVANTPPKSKVDSKTSQVAKAKFDITQCGGLLRRERKKTKNRIKASKIKQNEGFQLSKAYGNKIIERPEVTKVKDASEVTGTAHGSPYKKDIKIGRGKTTAIRGNKDYGSGTDEITRVWKNAYLKESDGKFTRVSIEAVNKNSITIYLNLKRKIVATENLFYPWKTGDTAYVKDGDGFKEVIIKDTTAINQDQIKVETSDAENAVVSHEELFLRDEPLHIEIPEPNPSTSALKKDDTEKSHKKEVRFLDKTDPTVEERAKSTAKKASDIARAAAAAAKTASIAASRSFFDAFYNDLLSN